VRLASDLVRSEPDCIRTDPEAFQLPDHRCRETGLQSIHDTYATGAPARDDER
jgi:hypothetical protein